MHGIVLGEVDPINPTTRRIINQLLRRYPAWVEGVFLSGLLEVYSNDKFQPVMM